MASKIFVIEHCENCHLHAWNTRHNEAQYKQHALNCKYKSYLIDINRELIIN